MPQLEFLVRSDPNDTSIQVKVQKIANGYVVKTGRLPVYYSTIEEAAQSISDGLVSVMNILSMDPDDIDYDNPDSTIHFEQINNHD